MTKILSDKSQILHINYIYLFHKSHSTYWYFLEFLIKTCSVQINFLSPKYQYIYIKCFTNYFLVRVNGWIEGKDAHKTEWDTNLNYHQLLC